MKHKIIDESGATLGTIDITPERAAEIAQAKAEISQHHKMFYGHSVGVWHFLAGDWLTDEEISALGTSHEMDVQIIPATEGGAQ